MTGAELSARGQAGRIHAAVQVGPVAADPFVDATACAGDEQDARPFTLEITVTPPWYIYAPGAATGLPIQLRADEPMRMLDVSFPPNGQVKIRGKITITGTVVGAQPGGSIVLRTQACDGPRCEPPTLARLTLVSTAPTPRAAAMSTAVAATVAETGREAL